MGMDANTLHRITRSSYGDPSKYRQSHEQIMQYTIKGGSYLCATNYCARYRAAARHPQELDLQLAMSDLEQ